MNFVQTLTSEIESASNASGNTQSDPFEGWLFGQIRPFVKGKILELNSGDGSMSSFLVRNGIILRLSDPHRSNCTFLENRFSGIPQIKGVHRIDHMRDNFTHAYPAYINRFDTLFIFNFTGKLRNLEIVLGNARLLLKQESIIVSILPIPTAPYNETDFAFHEWQDSTIDWARKQFGTSLELVKTRLFARLPNSDSSDPKSLFNSKVPIFHTDPNSNFNQSGLFSLSFAKTKAN